MKIPPYAQDPRDGSSRTREFLEVFLSNFFRGTPEDAVAMAQYRLPTGEESREMRLHPFRFLGRATAQPGLRSPHEFLWCVTADVAGACKRLKFKARKMLILRFQYGMDAYGIAAETGLHWVTVSNTIQDSLTKVANWLDQV